MSLFEQHDPGLVALSYLIAVLASFTALDLAGRAREAKLERNARTRWVWVAAAAAAMGGGIWAMHFVAMLAFDAGMAASYDPGLTALSLLAAVGATGVAFGLVSQRVGVPSLRDVAPAGLVMGLGVAAMHYIGMAAMRMAADPSYAVGPVVASVAVAIVAASAALWLAMRPHSLGQQVAASAVMGVAVAGMHYTGMLAFTVTRHAAHAHAPEASGLGRPALAIAVAGAAAAILFLALVVSSLGRRRAEQRAREGEDRFQAMADNIPQLAWMTDPSGAITWYNRRWYDYTGSDFARMRGWGWRTVHHPDHVDRVEAGFRRAIEAGVPWEDTFPLRGRDGTYRWFLSRAEPIRGQAGITRWFGTNTDVTERREVGERLRESEDRLRLMNATLEEQVEARTAERDRLWSVSRDLFLVVGLDGRYKRANPAWTTMLGYAEAEIVGAGFNDFIHPDDKADVETQGRRILDGASSVEVEARLRARDGSHRHIQWLIVAVGGELYATGRDVTELRAAEDQLRQAQKMEAVGQLTGGIAHDFNNMLAVVIGSLDLLGRRIDTGDARTRRHIEAATDGARRAALLTQRLLAFSRQQPLQPKPIDANKLVAGMSDLLRGSLGAPIRLETVLGGGLWRTQADPNQLENAILNLAVNARDAMPEGGRLTIETGNAHLDARYAAAHFGVSAGQYVLIAVTDTGSGMPPAVIAKAFDPFFTTKEVGKGTGLGLSQVYGFVKQSDGHVKVYSEPGQGTTVKLYLPRHFAADGDAADDEIGTDPPLGETQELVLVVEDEPTVRRFTADALAELGYRVLEADGAEAALQLLGAHPDVALLFTDVVMPDINGRKLADEARRRRPGLKVLFTTGYTRNAVVHNGVLDPDVELIGKPFTIEELAVKVRDVLDATDASSFERPAERSGGTKLTEPDREQA